MCNKTVAGHIKKALGNMESAQILINNGMYDSAVSSSYYAVFHAVSALLASKGMEFSNHKTVINKYNEVFINTGLISSISFRSLTALLRLRLDSEYDPIIFISEEGANEAMKLAQMAIQDILKYCREHNLNEEPV